MTPDQINDFFSFLYEGQWASTAFWLRMISGLISSAFLAAIAVIVFKFLELNRRIQGWVPPQASEAIPESISGPWSDVLKKVESVNPSDWNLAVIQADAALDRVFRDMGLTGQTMGDRLKQLDGSKFVWLDAVWEAHKLRNRIVHETDRIMTHEDARRAVEFFGQALGQLGYLQE